MDKIECPNLYHYQGKLSLETLFYIFYGDLVSSIESLYFVHGFLRRRPSESFLLKKECVSHKDII
jgi:hypothetical protein